MFVETLTNARAPIVVDDRDGKNYWLSHLLAFSSYSDIVPSGSLRKSRLYVFAPPATNHSYLEAAAYSGVSIVFLEDKCS
jgi:hypothetical protein